MSKGYGVFGHVPENPDADGLLPSGDDASGVSWGHALRRRNPWKSDRSDSCPSAKLRCSSDSHDITPAGCQDLSGCHIGMYLGR